MTKIYYANPELIENELEALGSGDAALTVGLLEPSPMISITTNLNYSNDNIVGYNYSINLSSVVVVDETDSSGGIGTVADKIKAITDILSVYGGTLYVTDNNNNILVKARGGTLQSINFQNSNNNWVKSAPFSASIDFQEIELSQNAKNCSSILIDDMSFSSDLVDIKNYKIKSFDDTWTFTIDDSSYSYIGQTLYGNNMDINNLSFSISYTINAVGKHHFVFNGADQVLTPAWNNARQFCTDRLYNQLTQRLSQLIDRNMVEHCEANETLDQIYQIPSQDNGLLDGLNRFYVFNEEISCAASESDGTFSVTYNAIVKRASDGQYYKHTFNHNEQNNSSSNRLINNGQSPKTITIDGTIEGLVLGGILYAYNGNFMLPANGKITPNSSNYNEKYNNAHNYLSSITNNLQTDFTDSHKSNLGITFTNLNIENGTNFCGNINSSYPKPKNFSVVRNITDGTINYTAEYSTDNNCGQKYANITVNIEKPVPVINTFSIPNGNAITLGNPNRIGTILQDIGTNTKMTMDISIQGRDPKYCCITPDDIWGIINIGTESFSLPTDINLPLISNSILTNKTKDLNIITGAYTINLSYVICDDGCSI